MDKSQREEIIGILEHYNELKEHLRDMERELRENGVRSLMPEIQRTYDIVKAIGEIYDKANETKRLVIREIYFKKHDKKTAPSDLYISEPLMYRYMKETVDELAAKMK